MIVKVGIAPTPIQQVSAGDLIYNTGLATAYVDTVQANVKLAPLSGAIPVAGGQSVQWAGAPGLLYGCDPTGSGPGVGVTSQSGLPFPAPINSGPFLIIPALQSNNFVANVSGWQIQSNGNAQFNNLALTGSTFTGVDFVVNPLGEFFYSAAPATGDLIASITPTGGANDGFGNPYQGGFTSYNTGLSAYVTMQSNAIAFHWPGNTSNGSIAGATGSVFIQSGKETAGDVPSSIDLLSSQASGISQPLVSVFNTFQAGQVLVGSIPSPTTQALQVAGAIEAESLIISPTLAAAITGALAEIQGSLSAFSLTSSGALTVQSGGMNITGNSIVNGSLTSSGLVSANGGEVVTGGCTIDNLNVTGKITSSGGTVSVPSLITTDPWHNIPLTATWTALGSGTTLPQYRANAIGMFDVKGEILFTSTGAGSNLSGSNSFSTALPAAYQPGAIQYFPAYVIGGSGTPVITANRSPIVRLDASGVFSVLNVSSTAGAGLTVQFGFKGSYQTAN